MSFFEMFDSVVSSHTFLNPLDEVWHPYLAALSANGEPDLLWCILFAFEVIGAGALVFLFFRYCFRVLLGKVN